MGAARSLLRASLATALLGVLAVWLLFRAAVSFGATRPAAALAAAIYAGAPLAWKTATYPEVFAGNACLALAIAWLSGPMPPVRGPRRAALLALLAGLGLAHPPHDRARRAAQALRLRARGDLRISAAGGGARAPRRSRSCWA
ncbi:MAG: hypothetical protein U0235_14690 [Polyangiaceae bacterium]